jgi:hypothetical protein
LFSFFLSSFLFCFLSFLSLKEAKKQKKNLSSDSLANTPFSYCCDIFCACSKNCSVTCFLYVFKFSFSILPTT